MDKVELRACLKRSRSGCQTSHHQLNHGEPDPCLSSLRQRLKIFTQPPRAIEPAECAFHDPTIMHLYRPIRHFTLLLGLLDCYILWQSWRSYGPPRVQKRKGSYVDPCPPPPPLRDSPVTHLWVTLPALNRQHLVWLLSQLLARQLGMASSSREDRHAAQPRD